MKSPRRVALLLGAALCAGLAVWLGLSSGAVGRSATAGSPTLAAPEAAVASPVELQANARSIAASASAPVPEREPETPHAAPQRVVQRAALGEAESPRDGALVRLRGRVMAPTGYPAADVSVSFGGAAGTTEIDGTFTLALASLPRDLPVTELGQRVDPGEALVLRCDGFPTQRIPDVGQVLLDAFPADPAPLELALPEELPIRGRVVDEDGRALAGWQVRASPAGAPSALPWMPAVNPLHRAGFGGSWSGPLAGGPGASRYVLTDASGRFSLDGLDPQASYDVAARSEGDPRRARAESVEAGTRDLVLTASGDVRGGRLHGIVRRRGGGPVPGARVAVSLWEGRAGLDRENERRTATPVGEVVSYVTTGWAPWVAGTDASGAFRIDDLPAVAGIVQISAPGLATESFELAADTIFATYEILGSCRLVLTSDGELPEDAHVWLLTPEGDAALRAGELSAAGSMSIGSTFLPGGGVPEILSDFCTRLAPLLGREIAVREDVCAVVVTDATGEEILRRVPLALSSAETTTLSL